MGLPCNAMKADGKACLQAGLSPACADRRQGVHRSTTSSHAGTFQRHVLLERHGPDEPSANVIGRSRVGESKHLKIRSGFRRGERPDTIFRGYCRSRIEHKIGDAQMVDAFPDRLGHWFADPVSQMSDVRCRPAGSARLARARYVRNSNRTSAYTTSNIPLVEHRRSENPGRRNAQRRQGS
jgi:hypothetical protein